MLKELYLLWLRLAAPQDLHYINGADTLPPPLPPPLPLPKRLPEVRPGRRSTMRAVVRVP